MARIHLVEKDQAVPEVRELFQKIEDNGARVLNIQKAVANSPHIVRTFTKMGNSLIRRTELSPKLRELAILRVASLSGSEYEWTQHIPIARYVGISQEQISTIPAWEQSPDFNDTERAVLRYVDEVSQNIKVKDKTFNALQKHLSERELVELTLSIAYWGMVARILVALEIEIDDEPVSVMEDLQGRHTERKQNPHLP